MVDIIYNVLARPIANEPAQKDVYHVDRTHKDAKAKRIEDDDPQSNQQQSSEQNNQQAEDNELDKKLEPKEKGKGRYVDKDGIEHLDIFV